MKTKMSFLSSSSLQTWYEEEVRPQIDAMGQVKVSVVEVYYYRIWLEVYRTPDISERLGSKIVDVIANMVMLVNPRCNRIDTFLGKTTDRRVNVNLEDFKVWGLEVCEIFKKYQDLNNSIREMVLNQGSMPPNRYTTDVRYVDSDGDDCAIKEMQVTVACESIIDLFKSPQVRSVDDNLKKLYAYDLCTLHRPRDWIAIQEKEHLPMEYKKNVSLISCIDEVFEDIRSKEVISEPLVSNIIKEDPPKKITPCIDSVSIWEQHLDDDEQVVRDMLHTVLSQWSISDLREYFSQYPPKQVVYFLVAKRFGYQVYLNTFGVQSHRLNEEDAGLNNIIKLCDLEIIELYYQDHTSK